MRFIALREICLNSSFSGLRFSFCFLSEERFKNAELTSETNIWNIFQKWRGKLLGFLSFLFEEFKNEEKKKKNDSLQAKFEWF